MNFYGKQITTKTFVEAGFYFVEANRNFLENVAMPHICDDGLVSIDFASYCLFEDDLLEGFDPQAGLGISKDIGRISTFDR